MKKPNRPKLLLSILLSFSVTSCAPKPPDVPVCENLSQRLAMDPETEHLTLTPSPTCERQISEMECGHCTYIVSGKEIFVGNEPGHLLNGKSWDRIKLESVYVPAVESFGPLSDYIINSCKKLNCNNQVDAFKIKLDSLKDVGAAVKNH
jgi:hypothetical protein